MMSDADTRHLSPDELELFLPRMRETGAAADPRPEHRRHLEDCARCRREVARLEGLDRALAGLPSHEPSPRFADAVMARVRLPVPWYRRLWKRLAEQWVVAAIALLGAGAGAGLGLWIAARPELSLGGLADFALERLSALFWTVVVTAGQLLWESGLVASVRRAAGAVEPWEAVAGLAILSVVSTGVGWLMVRLLTAAPTRVHAARG